ncbi:MAG: hypothetical protein HY678_11055 [Chloroflexi bacterium]|nr:hypothetical protein [Chloroflexota bacterium]
MRQPDAFSGEPDMHHRSELLAIARECGEYVARRNPYLRILAVSGSLTRDEHEGTHTDADYFVVSRKGRVWEAFFGCVWNGWRFASRRGLARQLFCFNYVVDEGHPEEIDLSRAEYVREFLRLVVLTGHDAYLELLDRFRPRLESCEPDLYRQAVERASALEAIPSLPPGDRVLSPWNQDEASIHRGEGDQLDSPLPPGEGWGEGAG